MELLDGGKTPGVTWSEFEDYLNSAFNKVTITASQMNLEVTPKMFPVEEKGFLNGTVIYSGINASSFPLFWKNERLDVNEMKLDGKPSPFLQVFDLVIPLTKKPPGVCGAQIHRGLYESA